MLFCQHQCVQQYQYYEYAQELLGGQQNWQMKIVRCSFLPTKVSECSVSLGHFMGFFPLFNDTSSVVVGINQFIS